jgi:hypothetical protein
MKKINPHRGAREIWQSDCGAWITNGAWCVRKDLARKVTHISITREPPVQRTVDQFAKASMVEAIPEIHPDRVMLWGKKFNVDFYLPFVSLGNPCIVAEYKDPIAVWRNDAGEVVAMLMGVRE